MLETINLEGTPDLDIFRFANAQAAKGFTTKLPKLETPCEFYRKNKFILKNFCKSKNCDIFAMRNLQGCIVKSIQILSKYVIGVVSLYSFCNATGEFRNLRELRSFYFITNKLNFY